jgi:hypothetical protein
MRCNRVLKPLFLLFVLLIAVAALAANNQSAANSGSAFRTYLQPDLTFKSVLSPEFLPQTQGTQVAFSRTCRCSCGYPCKTNADCGPGGVCASGITCCNRGPQAPQNALFWGAASSSRSAAAPDLDSKCK